MADEQPALRMRIQGPGPGPGELRLPPPPHSPPAGGLAGEPQTGLPAVLPGGLDAGKEEAQAVRIVPEAGGAAGVCGSG